MVTDAVKVVKNVYSLDLTDLLSNKQKYRYRKSDKKFVYVGTFIPAEPHIFHSTFSSKEVGLTPEELKQKYYEFNFIETNQVIREPAFPKCILENVNIGSGPMNKTEATQRIEFNNEYINFMGEINDRPLMIASRHSFSVNSLFARRRLHLSTKQKTKEEKAIEENVKDDWQQNQRGEKPEQRHDFNMSVVKCVQPFINCRKISAERVGWRHDNAKGKWVPGIMQTAYGEGEAAGNDFSVDSATILPVAICDKETLKVKELYGMRHIVTEEKVNIEDNNALSVDPIFSEAAYEMGRFSSSGPHAAHLTEEDYKQVINVYPKLLMVEANKMFKLDDEKFTSLSWDAKTIILLAKLLELIENEFHGFRNSDEIWRFLFRLRHTTKYDLGITDKYDRTHVAHARVESTLIVQSLIQVGPTYINGATRGFVASCALEWEKEPQKYTVGSIPAFSEKSPRLPQLGKVNDMLFLVSPVSEKKGDCELYNKNEQRKLIIFSQKEQEVSELRNRFSLDNVLNTFAETMKGESADDKKAYIYRHPECLFMEVDGMKEWEEDDTMQCDLGAINLKDESYKAHYPSDKYTKLALTITFHDDYDKLCFKSDLGEKKKKKDKVPPADSIRWWIHRLTLTIFRLLFEQRDKHPELLSAVNNMIEDDPVTKKSTGKIDTALLKLLKMEETFGTFTHRMQPKKIENIYGMALLWNVLMNSLVYYPGQVTQPIQGFIDMTACNGVPQKPVHHDSSNYPGNGHYSEHISYPDGYYDHRNKTKNPQKNDMQVGISRFL